jgi:hypothetical protein
LHTRSLIIGFFRMLNFFFYWVWISF